MYSTLQPAAPTQIIIQPVKNGWIISMPASDNNNLQDQFEQVAPMLKGFVEGLRGDDYEADKIIREAERDMQREQKRAQQPQYQRDNSMIICDSFEKVLAYLAKHIQD